MEFKKIDFDFRYKNDLEFAYISKNSGGYISRNHRLFEKIPLNELNIAILNKCVFGTPIFKVGTGSNNVLILSGIHGNELPPQVASLKLINWLINQQLQDTVYIIPFAVPFTTMRNKREYFGRDLNRSSHIQDSLSGQILKTIKELGIHFVGDFHSSALNSNPGREAIFSSRFPSIESFLIASYISQNIGSEVIDVKRAGSIFNGAMEDECNLRAVPAITCEVLSPFGEIYDKSIQRSYLQMRTFLKYFGF